jgi:DNA-binding transcriptional ArsR family regulator
VDSAVKPLTSISDPRLVRALAHPLRLRILSVLEQRVASPKELAYELGAPLTHVSYHVRQLAQLGMIKLERTTPRRGAVEHHYRLDARPSITDEGWRGAPEIAKQALVGAVLGQLGAQVRAAASEAGFSRDGSHLQRLPLELDDEGWHEASKAIRGLVTKLQRIQADAHGRRKGPHPEVTAATAVLMLFETAQQRTAQSRTPVRRGHEPASTSPR